MTLKQLTYFNVLAQTEHYQQAADILEITQPVLSRAISSLEEELGVPLFEKHGRNVTLSREGRVFAEKVANAMRELDDGIEHLHNMHDPKKSVIDISINYAMANIYLPQILKNYRSGDGREMLFQFRQSNTPQILQDLRQGISEVGLCSFVADATDIRFIPIVRCPLAFFVPLHHPLASKESVTLEEVGRMPLIFSIDKTHYMEKLLTDVGIRPTVVCRMGEDRSIANLVSAGIGCTILPYDPQLDSCGIVQIPIDDPRAYRDFYLAISRERILSAHARDFCRFLMGRAQHEGLLENGVQI